LFEQVVGISRISADEESFEMLVNKPARRRTLGNIISIVHVLNVTKLLPPNPVAKPTVPSEPSISTQNEPKTLIPQLVLEARYLSHLDIGVDIGVSISLPSC
jgi:hypothetical protein